MTAEITIASRKIGMAHPPFLILEAGINHNGDLDLALEMVRVARELNADAIKFQTFKAAEFVGDPTLTYTYTSQGREVTEPMRAMFERCEFTEEQWRRIAEGCRTGGITFLSTPQNASDLELLLRLGLPAIKVGSDDFTNTPLLAAYAKTGLPMILSCGMADRREVDMALKTIGADRDYPSAILVCTSQYPTRPADANVARVRTLREAYPKTVVGFSDHTQGPHAAVIAGTLGACIFEKHFTLDHDLPGPDHWFSENPAGAATWIKAIRETAVVLGHGRIEPGTAERDMRAIARRSITALRDIAQDEVFTRENLGLRRPGTGLPPDQFEEVVGNRSRRAISAGEQLMLVDFLPAAQ